MSTMSTVDQSAPDTRVATPFSTEKPELSKTVSDIADLPPVENAFANVSRVRKLILMALFCTAQFLDAFNNRFVHTSAT